MASKFQASLRDALFKWVEEKRKSKLFEVGTGVPSDWADYRYRVGYLRALEEMQVEIEAIEGELQRG